MTARAFPLDLDTTKYSYIERPNTVLIKLLEKHVLSHRRDASILDVGCGAGANAAAVKQGWPSVHYSGVEPDARASELARQVMDDVFHGDSDGWLASEQSRAFDAVVLSDVIEHMADPVRFLLKLATHPATRGAVFVISIPNYAVWYNRFYTLFGHFRYEWSGLYDRTHLRFFTCRSFRELLDHCGLSVVDESSTPSIVQSAAPVLRRFFADDAARGDHRTLPSSRAFRLYRSVVEPMEQALCGVWPELLGFQLVTVARVGSR